MKRPIASLAFPCLAAVAACLILLALGPACAKRKKSACADCAATGSCPGQTQTTAAPQAPADAPEPEDNGGEPLFDGQSLKGWKVTGFAARGEVEVKDGKIILHQGVMTGVNYTNEMPRMDYEVSYEACRVDGSDFFASLTFPVGDSHCTLITGGWGGGVVGISSIDSMDAAENETTQFVPFENGKWYRFRVRVTKDKLEAWVDTKQVVNVNTRGKKLDVRPGEIEESRPFGFATWASTGAIKNVRLKRLD